MNIIVYLVVGGIIGWLASIVMRTNAQQGILLNIVVGVVGAFVAGWFLTPLFGVSTINQANFSMPALLVSLGGAILLLAAVRLFSRGGLRMR
ncbi:MAG TPA: GlsB/YeaQ/YmgE family stress response membrane protein [Anaerolineae bacterium]|nr:GlsB/YeaQ/YmgE family stress response membrane protein [Anaerolineae bacterium]